MIFGYLGRNWVVVGNLVFVRGSEGTPQSKCQCGRQVVVSVT